MCAQLRKLETILDAHRRNARFVKERIKDLPGVKLRACHDPEGEIGIAVALQQPSKDSRDKFLAAMKAENVPMSAPTAAIVLPIQPYIENKVASHAAWPTFNTPRGKAIRYGRECCPRTVDLYDRTATLTIGPKYSEGDLSDIVAAVSKVHNTLLAST